MAKVFKITGRPGWYYKVKVEGQWKLRKAYSDKRASEQKMADHQATIDRGEVGLLDQFAEHKKRALADHFDNYIDDMKAKGRAGEHIANTKRFLLKIAADCNWQRTSDISADSIVRWRTNFNRSPRTKNAYLIAAKAFCTWMTRQGRMAANPLATVGRVEQRGHEVRVRRALSDAEITRLLNVAGEYRTVYLTALTTGLRKGELAALCWGDVRLNAARPFINVRASISKNHKTATMFLRQDVATALAAIKPQDADDNQPVFIVPGRKRFYSHLKTAKIARKDSQGRIVDFHAGSANFSGVTRYFIVITHVFVVQMPFGMIRHGPTPDLLADPSRPAAHIYHGVKPCRRPATGSNGVGPPQPD